MQVAHSQREELSGAALWTGREELLDSAVETRLRARAMEAKVDALQEGLDQLLQAARAGVPGGPEQGRQQVLRAVPHACGPTCTDCVPLLSRGRQQVLRAVPPHLWPYLH